MGLRGRDNLARREIEKMQNEFVRMLGIQPERPDEHDRKILQVHGCDNVGPAANGRR